MSVESTPPQHPTGAVRWAAGIVIAQGVLLGLGALSYAGWALAARPEHTGLALGIAVVAAVFALVLLAGGRPLARGARPSVSPILIIELLMLPVAWSMAQAGQWAVAAALAVPALAVVALLFSPEGRAVMRGGR